MEAATNWLESRMLRAASAGATRRICALSAGAHRAGQGTRCSAAAQIVRMTRRFPACGVAS
jgi:hypothetical protein